MLTCGWRLQEDKRRYESAFAEEIFKTEDYKVNQPTIEGQIAEKLVRPSSLLPPPSSPLSSLVLSRSLLPPPFTLLPPPSSLLSWSRAPPPESTGLVEGGGREGHGMRIRNLASRGVVKGGIGIGRG